MSSWKKVAMESASDGERGIRAARNQALFRAVNEKMRELKESFGQRSSVLSAPTTATPWSRL
jgi:hypothetical protein